MTGMAQAVPVVPGVVSSFLWLNIERFGRLSLGFAQTMMVARHLGPAGFGAINGSVAIVALFTGLTTLGLDSIVARRLALASTKAGALLGTAVAMRVLVGGVVVAGLVAFRPAGSGASVHTVIAFTALAQALQAGDSWFVSTGRQRRATIIRLAVFLFAFVVRVVCVFAGAGVLVFAVVFVAEAIVSAVLVLLRAGAESRSRFAIDFAGCGRELIQESWPVIISAVGTAVCMRIDLVVVTRSIPHDIAGVYAAAVRLNELFYFVATAISGATIGSLVRTHQSDPKGFREVQAAIAALASWAGLIIAVAWAAGGGIAVRLLFGAQYDGAGAFLRVLAFGNVAVFCGTAWSVFWLALRLQKTLMVVTASASIATLIATILLARRFGAMGAAYGALVGQFLPLLLVQGSTLARQAFGEMLLAGMRPVRSALVIRDWLHRDLRVVGTGIR